VGLGDAAPDVTSGSFADMTALIDGISTYGVWLLGAMAFLETSFVTGLVVPAGVALSLATVTAMEGALDFHDVALTALVGGFCGDSTGFWVGRLAGERLLGGRGPWAARAEDGHRDLNRFLGRHPVFSVTVARLVSFIRTFMPMAAGASDISYPRFLAYEVTGLVGWVAVYMSIGLLAGESWRLATRVVGTGSVLVFMVVGWGFLKVIRKKGVGRGARR